MKRHFLLLLLFSLLWQFSVGFTFDPLQWYNFTGTLHQKQVSLTLFQTQDGKVYGNYSDCSGTNKVLLEGSIAKNKVLLTGLQNGKPFETFELQNISDSTDRLQGFCSSNAGKEKLAVSFRLAFACSGTLEQRYADFLGVDDDVEQFMRSVQTAIKKNDRAWIANHVQYPIRLTTTGNKRELVKSSVRLLQVYDKIFTPSLKSKILAACSCNLFTTNEGVMLGDGEIWINQKKGSTESTYDFVIIAIN